MNRHATRFLAVVGLQFLLLFSVVGFKQYVIASGMTVLLKVQPVDPRSLFQGDYVHLRYDISNFRSGQLAGDDVYSLGSSAYVELARGDDGYWRGVAIYRGSHHVPAGHVLIKGKVEDRSFAPNSSYGFTYGIEDVFVPEGSGRAVETARGDIGVEVKVDRFGNAVARRIIIGGQPFKPRVR